MSDNITAALDASASGSGRKRPRTSAMYQRKRAVTACQPCRARKTKCDNIRPTCGFCSGHGAQCIYSDADADHSSFDPASLAILNRLNHVVSLIENHHSKPLHSHVLPETLAQFPQTETTIPYNDEGNIDDLDFADDLLNEAPAFPASASNCESVLKWPIFQKEAPQMSSFVLDSGHEQPSCSSMSRNGPATLGRGVREEDFIALSRRFLKYVHIKNPILDVLDFTRTVKIAAESGLQWDGPSCLVLIACSLGCISMPFNSEHQFSQENSALKFENRETSAAYYLAAKKRLGLIEPSFLGVQCLFLCGVLEMYHVNALKAWQYFHQACVQLQNLFWMQGHTQSSYEDQIGQETRRIQQRLYWSCMKSECELRCEIPLPPSGISRIGFPDILPSPPSELLSPPSHPQPEDGLGSLAMAEREEERSWFYYLAEISFRRMMNRAFTAFGQDGETGWLNNFPQNIIRHRAFDEQIDFWCSHIPPQIRFNPNESLNHELAHLVRARAIMCREWIHRPFLYYVIHQPFEDPFFNQALPLAKRCLELSVETQMSLQPFHRHHGSWYVARGAMTRILLFLAAARSKKIEMPEGWEEALDDSVSTLRYWADESLDLEKAWGVLRDLIEGS